jgi:ribonuclease HII
MLEFPSVDRIGVATDEAGRGALAFNVCAAAPFHKS